MFDSKAHRYFMRLCLLLASVACAAVAVPLTAVAQVEPPNSTVGTTTLANPNPNNFDTPNIINAFLTPHSDLVLLSAHRGIHALAGLDQAPGIPENSLRSIGLAAQAGWEMLELDVKLTSDGVPILSHDKTWGREWCGLSPVPVSQPYDPFTAPGSTYNDAANPGVTGTTLSNTRSYLGNTVLRDSVSLLSSWGNHGCSGYNNSFGEYPPTLADALDYMARNHVRMVLMLDIQGLDIAQAALSVVNAKNDDAGRPFRNSVIFKMPMSVFPNGISDFGSTFGAYSTLINFIPVINTANVAPTGVAIADTEDGGFDVTDVGNFGMGGESGILTLLQHFEVDDVTAGGVTGPIRILGVEVNMKEPGGILSTVLYNARNSLKTGLPMTIGEFNPVGEYYPGGNTTLTPEFFRSSNGGCCDVLAQYLYNNPNGTGPIDPSQPVDHSDQRTDRSFMLAQNPQYIISDDPLTLSNLLQQQNKRNICYLSPGPLSNCSTGGVSSLPIPSTIYNVVNTNSGLCLDVANMGVAPGTSLVQTTCGAGQSNQQWQFASVGNGIYGVTNQFAPLTWSVAGGAGATSNGASLELDGYTGDSSQQWQAVLLGTDTNGNNTYKFIVQNSASCMDVPAASTTSGVQLDQYGCNGTNAQSFRLVPALPASASSAPSTGIMPDPNIWYNVVNVNDGSCLDVYNWGTALGTSLDQWTCGTGQANQQWQFIPADNGNYEVSSNYVAAAWNVTGGTGATANGVPIQVWSYNGDANEQWKPMYVSTDSSGNKIYNFIAGNDGLCLDVPGASSQNGLQLDQFACNGTNAQNFKLVPVMPATASPVTPTAPATPPPTPNVNLWYNVVNVNDGSCLDVYNWGTTLGTNLDQWTCGNGQANQQWQFMPTSNGYYQVSSRYLAASWDVTGGTGAMSNGVPIQLWSYGGGSNEQWQAVFLYTDGNGNSVYKFIAQNSGLCLDTPAASSTNGLQLDQYTCNGTNAQAFTLVSVNPAVDAPVTPTTPAPPPPPSPDGNLWYNVVNVNDGSCLDVYNWGTALATGLDQWTCGSGQANQQWQFVPTGASGVYQVKSNYLSASWNVTGGTGATGNGVPIQLWSYGGDSNEQWQAVYLWTDGNGNNVYKFIAQNSGLCLDTPGASWTNGVQLDQYGCNGTNAQAFTLVSVSPSMPYPVIPTPPVTTYADVSPLSSGTLVTGGSGGSGTLPTAGSGGYGTVPIGGTGGSGTLPTGRIGSPGGGIFTEGTSNDESLPNYGTAGIQNVNSGLCVDVDGAAANGRLIQWPCWGGDVAQQWQFSLSNSHAVYYVANPNLSSWLIPGTPMQVWDIAGGPTVTWDGAGLDSWGYNSQTNQQWVAVKQSNGSYNFVSVSSGKCLDVPGSTTQVGAQLDIWDCNGTTAQQFWVYTNYVGLIGALDP